MKTFLTFLTCLLFGTIFSQYSATTRNVQLLARGKALGFVIIEDRWVRSFSAGAELKLYDQFSIVADIVHFRWRYEEEVHDLPDKEDYSEYSLYDTRNYLALELRYYPKFFRPKYVWPYINVYSKLGGKRNLYVEEKYPLTEGDVFWLNSSFYDLGFSAGAQMGGRFGVDVSIGAAFRKENKSEQVYHIYSPVTITENDQENRWLGNIRVNFYWNFAKPDYPKESSREQ